MLFEKDEQAVAYMEPIDVRNGEYRVFDVSGRSRPLIVSETERRGPFGVGRTLVATLQIGKSEDSPEGRTEAVEAISGYLQSIHGVTPRTPSFSEVVELLLQHDGYTR